MNSGPARGTRAPQPLLLAFTIQRLQRGRKQPPPKTPSQYSTKNKDRLRLREYLRLSHVALRPEGNVGLIVTQGGSGSLASQLGLVLQF